MEGGGGVGMGSVQTLSSHFHSLPTLPTSSASWTLGVFQAICPTQALRASESADYSALKVPVRHGRGRPSEPTIHFSQKILHEICALCQERSHARLQWPLRVDPGLAGSYPSLQGPLDDGDHFPRLHHLRVFFLLCIAHKLLSS